MTRTEYAHLLYDLIPRGKTKEEVQACIEAMLLHAVTIYSALHHMPATPESFGTLAGMLLDGLDYARNEWNSRN